MLEDAKWAKITKRDISCGVVVIGGKQAFDVLFWANVHIRSKFPGRARVFNSVFAAITHEATNVQWRRARLQQTAHTPRLRAAVRFGGVCCREPPLCDER